MTLVVAWLGVDARWPTSAYIASDSRITWQNSRKFDYARKVFAFSNYPDILGYCGDVLFPSIVLSQIVEMGDCGLLFKEDYTSEQKFGAIMKKLVEAFNKYPEDIPLDDIQLIHVSREKSNNKSFFCRLIKWNRKFGWETKNIVLPDKSGLLFAIGSGSTEFKKNYEKYQEGPNASTSRNIFHCFFDTLFNIRDKYCGGAPQLVGIISKPGTSSIKYGVIKENKRYLFGAEVDNLTNFDNIESRNDDFEICDGQTKKRKGNAMKQPNPFKLK